MRAWAAPAIALALAACAEERSRASRKDCEAVLAHLIVLESESAPLLCRFHPNCGGGDDDEAKFLQRCPAVLPRRELACYQRATTLAAADACLDRAALVARIETGVVEETRAGAGARDDWSAFGPSPEEQALASLRRLRDEACACLDELCAEGVERELELLITRWEARHGKPSEALEREGERIWREAEICLDKF